MEPDKENSHYCLLFCFFTKKKCCWCTELFMGRIVKML